MDQINPNRALRLPALIVGLLSTAILIGLFYWIYFLPGQSYQSSSWVARLPALNAILNSLSAIFLSFAIIAIKKKKILAHQRLIFAALFFSALFLVSYLIYHYYQGDTPFQGQGLIRPVYFFILITHIVGSIAALPLILWTLFLAYRKRFDLHPKWARWTAPLWLYVSVTGVAVFFLLRAYA